MSWLLHGNWFGNKGFVLVKKVGKMGGGAPFWLSSRKLKSQETLVVAFIQLARKFILENCLEVILEVIRGEDDWWYNERDRNFFIKTQLSSWLLSHKFRISAFSQINWVLS